MKKLTSIVLAAVSAVLLACAFSACGNPNGSSGGNNNTGSDDPIVLEGTYSGRLTDEDGTARSFTITVDSDGTASFFFYNTFTGPVTLEEYNFTITGAQQGGAGTIVVTGTVSRDGTSLSNITVSDEPWEGTLTLEQ